MRVTPITEAEVAGQRLLVRADLNVPVEGGRVSDATRITRFAEGNHCGFFGWPNLTLIPTGGYLGMPGSNKPADMRVTDIYRRDGDKLAENWVIIDLLHFLNMQGYDVLERFKQLNP